MPNSLAASLPELHGQTSNTSSVWGMSEFDVVREGKRFGQRAWTAATMQSVLIMPLGVRHCRPWRT